MNLQEVTGALASGGRFRATSYMVELTNPDGAVAATFDANDFSGVQRNGQVVKLKRRKGDDVTVNAATLDDAGRLEALLRASVGVAAAPTKAGGGFGKVLKWGCLGTVGFFVLIGVLAAALSGGDDTTGPDAVVGAAVGSSSQQSSTTATGSASNGTNANSAQESATKALANIGDMVILEDDGWTLAVTGVRKTSSTEFMFSEEQALGVYLIVDLSLENIANEKHKLTGDRFTVVDDKGRKYEYFSRGTIGYGQQQLASDINPGLSAPATILFDVPVDATGLVLKSLGGFEVSLGNVADIPQE